MSLKHRIITFFIVMVGILHGQVVRDGIIRIPVAISAGRSNFRTAANQLFMETANGRRPTMSRGPAIFMADIMIYDEPNGIGYAAGNLRFADTGERVFMSAEEGAYYTQEEKIVLYKVPEVLVQSGDTGTLRINGTLITVYPNDYYMYVQGNVELNDGQTLISGQEAKIWIRRNRMVVTGEVQARVNQSQALTSDRLNVQFTNGGLDSYTAVSNVTAVSYDDKITLISQYLNYTETNKFFRAVDDPLIYFYDRGTVAYANVVEYSTDTQFGTLIGNVVAVQTGNNQKAYARWANYYGESDQIRMIGNPRLEQGESQLLGTEIVVHINSNTMEILGGGQGFLDQNEQTPTETIRTNRNTNGTQVDTNTTAPNINGAVPPNAE
ncbi:MAG: LptA/OstA family protein [Brevinema sp.]